MIDYMEVFGISRKAVVRTKNNLHCTFYFKNSYDFPIFTLNFLRFSCLNRTPINLETEHVFPVKQNITIESHLGSKA